MCLRPDPRTRRSSAPTPFVSRARPASRSASWPGPAQCHRATPQCPTAHDPPVRDARRYPRARRCADGLNPERLSPVTHEEPTFPPPLTRRSNDGRGITVDAATDRRCVLGERHVTEHREHDRRAEQCPEPLCTDHPTLVFQHGVDREGRFRSRHDGSVVFGRSPTRAARPRPARGRIGSRCQRRSRCSAACASRPATWREGRARVDRRHCSR